ncbi:MAG: two pore domain potassium channel family protein [Pseudomonadota bacterium]|nr:two pore domain potassium channel family protein [Pseudomonadota bacterium]
MAYPARCGYSAMMNNLFTQLAAATVMLVLMAVTHGLGVVGISRLLKLDDLTLKAHRFDLGALGLLTAMALSLFALHGLEIWMFAAFYLIVGALPSLEEALFYSASMYSTIGTTETVFPREWRIVGALEGLVGFLLIGWSTAVFVTDMNKLLRESDQE